MRAKLFSLFLLLAVAFGAQAQNIPGKLVEWVETGDTVGTVDTVSWELSINGTVNKTKPWEYSLIIDVDDDGSPSGDVYLQYSNSEVGSADELWVTADSDTILASGQTTILFEGILYAKRIRVYTIGSDAALRMEGVLRRRDY